MKMTKEEAVEFFSALFHGDHHIPGGGVKPHGIGWEIACFDDLSTYDLDMLTRLVFLAHDFCYRAVIQSCNPGRVRIVIFKRLNRDGEKGWERHPTIDQALAAWREKHGVT